MISGIALIIGLFAGFHSPISAQHKAVPEVNFASFQNQLKHNTDTVYVINFWATWCAPCRKELPLFEKIHNDYSGKKVSVLLVSLDFPKQAQKSLSNFIEDNKITAPVILLNEPDANTWIDKVDVSWSGAIPATLIYKKTNRKFFEKELTYDEISNSISFLNKL
ncbi:MAG TPA: TlpA disulfide reductase family protein [Bacteroidales bacterium]|nr:TlpA disulfide reductase family protein [Bacteroidales bacterium]